MDRIRSVVYKPYWRHDSLADCTYLRSKNSNPLVYHYEDHLRRTYQALADLKIRSMNGHVYRRSNRSYFHRQWFKMITDDFDFIIERVRVERAKFRAEANLHEPDNKDYSKWMMMLELACSLIYFCDDPRYRTMDDREVEAIRFPLSKWSRSLIHKIEIYDDVLHVQVQR